MAARRPRSAQLVPRDLRLEERQAVDRDVPVLVGSSTGSSSVRRLGADVQTRGGQQAGEGAEPAGRVVVAGRQDDGGAGAPQPGDDPVEHRRWRRPTGTARS